MVCPLLVTSCGHNMRLCNKVLGIEFLQANCTPRENLDSVASSNHLSGVGEEVRVLWLTCFLCALFSYSYHFQSYKIFQ